MPSNKSRKNAYYTKVQISYRALINWIEKAEEHKGHPESRLFIKNAENYAKSLLQASETVDISKELKRLKILKEYL